MKKINALLIGVCILLVLTACGQSANSTTPAAVTSEPVSTSQPVVETPKVVPIEENNIIKLSSTDSSKDVVKVDKTQTEIDLTDVTYLDSFIQQATQFKSMEKIVLGHTNASLKQLEELRYYFPTAILTYSEDILGTTYANNASTIDISSGSSEDVSALCDELKKFPALFYIELMKEDGTSSYSLDDVNLLNEACPNALINYEFELFGQTVSTAAERLEYVKVSIGNAGLEKFREILPYMKNLTYLLLDSCEIDYELLAQLNEDFPETRVVWRIVFSYDGYNCLTDTQKIWATGSVTDGYTAPLKYCTDVKYLDLGHDCITHIDFINYMPNLEVAVLAITWITDLTPLSNCPNLEYLEIFTSNVTDISPLGKCTNLEYLNISNLPSVRDLTSLYSLTKLKRLYCAMSYIPDDQQQGIREALPDCEFEFGWVDPSKYDWRFDSEGNRLPRYQLLCEQFGYDTYDYSR